MRQPARSMRLHTRGGIGAYCYCCARINAEHYLIIQREASSEMRRNGTMPRRGRQGDSRPPVMTRMQTGLRCVYNAYQAA